MPEFPKEEQTYDKVQEPTFIFITGASGAGKSTVAAELKKLLGQECVIIPMDNYFCEIPLGMDLGQDQQETNFDTPDKLCLAELSRHLQQLRRWEPIEMPKFNFETSLRDKPSERINACNVVTVEGIYALLFAQQYIRPLGLRMITVNVGASSYRDTVDRRIKRNVREYGQDFESVKLAEKQYVGPGFFKYCS